MFCEWETVKTYTCGFNLKQLYLIWDLYNRNTGFNMQKVKLIQGLLLFCDWWHFSNFFFFSGVQPPHALPLFFFFLYSLQVLSNFLDLLPLLLQFCWPWNQFLMGTQWPRAEPTCCIQMWPPAIISRLPTLYKQSFNNLSSHGLINLHISYCSTLGCCQRQLYNNSAATSAASTTRASGRHENGLLTMNLCFNSLDLNVGKTDT